MSPDLFPNILALSSLTFAAVVVYDNIRKGERVSVLKNGRDEYKAMAERNTERCESFVHELQDAYSEADARENEAREAKAELTKVVGFIWGFPPLDRNAQDICNHIAEQNRLIRESEEWNAGIAEHVLAVNGRMNSLKVENAKLMEYAPTGAIASRMNDMAWALKTAASKFREMEKLCLAEQVRDGEAKVHQEYARMCEKALGNPS